MSKDARKLADSCHQYNSSASCSAQSICGWQTNQASTAPLKIPPVNQTTSKPPPQPTQTPNPYLFLVSRYWIFPSSIYVNRCAFHTESHQNLPALQAFLTSCMYTCWQPSCWEYHIVKMSCLAIPVVTDYNYVVMQFKVWTWPSSSVSYQFKLQNA